jgi:hypothetical protein
MNLKEKKIFRNAAAHLLVLSILFIPMISLGQGSGSDSGFINTPGATAKVQNPISTDNLNDFIKKILEAVIKIGIPLVALAIIYSGFLFVFARGNSEKLKTAKNALLYSVIGAVILLGAWALAKVIADTVREL